MTLIDETIIDNINFKFYNGIDFNLAMNHPKDGSDGFIYFFIESWVSEVKSQRRNDIINSILGDESTPFNEELDNNYILIYQTNGDISVYEIIRNKLNSMNNLTWVPVHGITSRK